MQRAYTLTTKPTFALYRALTALLFLLTLGSVSHAQLTVNLVEDASGDPNATRIDFVVEDFTDIVALQYTIQWDPAIAQFDSLSYPSSLNIGPINFNATPAFTGQGRVGLAWTDSQGLGQSLSDGSTIFSLHLRFIDAGATTIAITGNPVQIEVTQRTNGNNVIIPLNTSPLQINGVQGAALTINPVLGTSNPTTARVDFVVEDFSDIVAMQYSINWDPSVAQFDSISYTSALNISASNFNTTPSLTDQGQVSFSWSSAPSMPETLPDGTTIISLYLNLIDTGSSDVAITGNPTAIQIGQDTGGGTVDIPLFTSPLQINGLPQTDLTIDVVTGALDATSARLDFVVKDFEDIIAMQFSINWDPLIAQFDSITHTDMLMINSTNFNVFPINLEQGRIGFLWTDPTSNGQSLPDGSVMLSLFLNLINTGSTDVAITSNPVAIEIVKLINGIPTIIPLNSTPSQINGTGALISGKVFIDDAQDCTFDGNEGGLGGVMVRLEGTATYTVRTRRTGDYTVLVDSGDYVLSVIEPSLYWEACQDYPISVVVDDVVMQDIPVQPTVSCPAMTVDVSTPFLRRCFPNNYRVNYCNNGTDTAFAATVEIELDPSMHFITGDGPFTTNGDTSLITFEIGDVAPNECGDFRFAVLLDCDSTALGQTHCVTANIFPDSLCIPPPANWSRASLEIDGTCNEQEVIFEIRNVGTGDMINNVEYIVIEDVIMREPVSFSLSSGRVLGPISFPANGTTYRMEVEQVPNHPGDNQPSLVIEGCGTDGNGNFSLGFVNQFSQNDGNATVSIDCQQNRGAFDPNDKRGFPTGYGNEHFIKANTDLEYIIRFQNTGTDTAFTVVILDTLSTDLDITSLELGASSHDYELEILGKDVAILQFTFNNIMLPDSNINEPASHGFIKLRMAQKEDLPDGTVINNQAAIYFDFNPPIYTNTTFHTIGENFISVSTQQLFMPDLQVNLFPNPTNTQATFQLEGRDFRQLHLSLFDATGRQVRDEWHNSNTFSVDSRGLSPGTYFYTIEGDGQLIGNGKLVVSKGR
ncbi:MAG: T9SS type A sorting domain-containing protein [Bacteroidota bacterium]